jgi:hypothetical protein
MQKRQKITTKAKPNPKEAALFSSSSSQLKMIEMVILGGKNVLGAELGVVGSISKTKDGEKSSFRVRVYTVCPKITFNKYPNPELMN